jgi:glucose-6-phosphate isomerase
MSDRTLLPTWQSLQAHAASLERHHLRQLFADDPGRFEALSVTALDFIYDFSRQRLTPDTMVLLLALARDCGLEERIRALFAGEPSTLPSAAPRCTWRCATARARPRRSRGAT